MSENSNIDTVRSFYTALAQGDRESLDALLHPDLIGQAAEGMPFGIGGAHEGAQAMRRNFWGMIARHFDARAEPQRFLELADGRLLVTGRYLGFGKNGGAGLDAAFAHLITLDEGRIVSLEQYTDTKRWQEAAAPMRTLTLEVAEGVATLCLNRPDKGNAIDEAMAADLLEAATRISEREDVRAVLIKGNGPHFSLGGDIGLFASTAREELPNRLRRMIDKFHTAIARFMALDAPIVAAIHGGAGGGGLGLMYVADITIAAEDAQFAIGYARLGLTADGGNTWFLPRLVGMQKAKELFILNRRLDAAEAEKIGLVTRVCPADALDAEAGKLVAELASGPTRAYGEIRRMLAQSFQTGLTEQLGSEVEAIIRVASSDDTQEGIAAFVAKRAPSFSGR